MTTTPVRIVSLLGSATEIVYALGLEEHLVGISHECDFPEAALRLPRVSRPRFEPGGLTSGEIDAEVRRAMEESGSVYRIDRQLLADLRPTLVLTQAVCEVCAVPTGAAEEAIAGILPAASVVSLDAHSLEGILATILQVAEAAGVPERGAPTIRRLRDRLDRTSERVRAQPRPRVLLLEWLDPPFAPGHWVPEMVAAAGGANLVGNPGAPSRQVGWGDLEGLDPDVLLIEPCGFDLEQSAADAERHRARLQNVAARAIREGRAWVLHSGWFSRSGPRVVEGVELLAGLLHPSGGAEPIDRSRAISWT